MGVSSSIGNLGTGGGGGNLGTGGGGGRIRRALAVARSRSAWALRGHKAPLRAVPWPRGSGYLPLLHTGPLQRAVSWPLKGASGFPRPWEVQQSRGPQCRDGWRRVEGQGQEQEPWP